MTTLSQARVRSFPNWPMAVGLFCLLIAAAGCTGRNVSGTTALDSDWSFHAGDVSSSTTAPTTQPAWTNIELPHCYNIAAATAGDTKTFGTNPIAWYRTTFTPAKSLNDKRTIVRFGAIGSTAEVFVNDQSVGKHIGGYQAFEFDITDALKFGQPNVLSVRVDQRNQVGPPTSGDFTRFGGIYRDVTLRVVEPIHFDTLGYAALPVQTRQFDVSEKQATLELAFTVKNDSKMDRKGNVMFTLTDASGKSVATFGQDVSAKAGETQNYHPRLTIPTPHLWNGLADPYLYSLKSELIVDGKVAESYTADIGFRYFSADPEKGFSLNGKSYPLHGVNRHQDRPNKGWAISRADMEEDLALLKEIGANVVRCAHYQHDPYFYSLCDKAGLIVWAEAPLVNNIPSNREAFCDNAKQQLRELILQNINHPSICFWSLWNEMNFSSNKETKVSELDKTGVKFLTDLNAIAKELDATRLTTGATAAMGTGLKSGPIADLFAWNYYPGWYAPSPKGYDGMLATLKEKYPKQPIAISEYGAGANIQHHALNPSLVRHDGPFHPEEWQAKVHEENYNSMKKNPWLWGTFVWNMFDFSSIGRKEGGAVAINDKGLVTHDRKTRKDAFYFYKAQWNPEPMVHINSRRYTPHPVGPATIKVYTNGTEVELFVNGQSIGKQSPTGAIATFPDVVLSAGQQQIKAVATFPNGKNVTDDFT